MALYDIEKLCHYQREKKKEYSRLMKKRINIFIITRVFH